jgi:hypothetical protein
MGLAIAVLLLSAASGLTGCGEAPPAADERATWEGPFDWTTRPLDLAPGTETAALPDPETQLRGLLGESPSAEAAIETYNSAEARAAVPDDLARAAVLALTGTPAEPAVAILLRVADGRPAVAFADATVLGQSFGMNIDCRDGTTAVRLQQSLRSAPVAALSAILAHEALHADPASFVDFIARDGLYAAARPEELISLLVEIWTWASQLQRDPSLARLGSDSYAVSTENERLFRLLNSERGPGGGFDVRDGAGRVDDLSDRDAAPPALTSTFYADDLWAPSVGSTEAFAVLDSLAGSAVPESMRGVYSEDLLAWLVEQPPPLDENGLTEVVAALDLRSREVVIDLDYSDGTDDAHVPDLSAGTLLNLSGEIRNRSSRELANLEIAGGSVAATLMSLRVGDRTLGAAEVAEAQNGGWVPIGESLPSGGSLDVEAQYAVSDDQGAREYGVWPYTRVRANGLAEPEVDVVLVRQELHDAPVPTVRGVTDEATLSACWV